MARCHIPLSKENGAFFISVLVDNTFAVKAKRKIAGLPIPDPFRTFALIDTGAGTSAASPKLIEALDLPTQSDKVIEIETAGGLIESYTYFGAVSLEEEPSIGVPYSAISQFDLPEESPFQFIIGMNILKKWEFSYAPKDHGMWITYPPA